VKDADGIQQVQLITKPKKNPPGYTIGGWETESSNDRTSLTDWKLIAGNTAVTVEFNLNDALEGLGWKRNGATWINGYDQSALPDTQMKWKEVIRQDVTIQILSSIHI